MSKSKIEWTERTWNPVTGCTRVSPGCDNCYAERMSRRLQYLPKYEGIIADGRWTGEVRCHEEVLQEPYTWRKPTVCFVCSMSDLFHSKVPWEFIHKVFNVMADNPQHIFQVLTKRPGRMAYFGEMGGWIGAEKNVWAGTSVESRKYLPRIKLLAEVPAQVRFVSFEPLLEALGDIGGWLKPLHDSESSPDLPFHWAIVGAESGPGSRPMEESWVRSIRDQCVKAGVKFFYKQNVVDGKKVSLPFLDGRVWKEVPLPSSQRGICRWEE